MVINQHSGVAIAQTVAYVPIVPLAIYIMIRNRSHPPWMAWYPFILFSMMRLAGGPVALALQNNDTNTGLVIAALILLNVGLIPLLIATLGLIRLILADNPQIYRNLSKITALARLGFIAAVTLLAAGSGMVGHSTGRILTVAGNAMFAIILAGLIIIELVIWRKSSILIPHTKKALTHATLAVPFLVARTVYALVGVAKESDPTSPWNPVYGNATLFGILCLLMEYITLCLYAWIGLNIPCKQGDEVPLARSNTSSRHRKTNDTVVTPENRRKWTDA